jgi:hypothetical protein
LGGHEDVAALLLNRGAAIEAKDDVSCILRERRATHVADRVSRLLPR